MFTEERPFVIAEISANHNQSLDRALEIVEAAAEAGANAIKLQTYTPEGMTLDRRDDNYTVSSAHPLWGGKSLFSLFTHGQTPWEWHQPIFEYAKSLGLVYFSAPFELKAVDFLEGLNVPCYKIASFEAVDLGLIKKVALTGKPIIISTGMSTVSDIAAAVDIARRSGCEDITLLKCTSSYPASPTDSNLRTIPHLKQLFNCRVGISDHTLGCGAAAAAIALGATVVEKHITLSREDGGLDSKFSLEPKEFKQLVEEVNRSWDALGTVNYGPTNSELASSNRRRSLYVVKRLEAGEVLSLDNIKSLRPGLGISCKYLDTIIGKRVNQPIAAGTPMSWDFIG